MICDEFGIDYEDIKSKLPKPEDNVSSAKSALDGVVIDEPVGTMEVKNEAEDTIGKALNGAQTKSLLSIIEQFKAGQLTSEEAVSIISISIGISEEKVRKLLHIGDVK